MNALAYKVVWSAIRQCWVVVSEIITSHGARSSATRVADNFLRQEDLSRSSLLLLFPPAIVQRKISSILRCFLNNPAPSNSYLLNGALLTFGLFFHL